MRLDETNIGWAEMPDFSYSDVTINNISLQVAGIVWARGHESRLEAHT
jgi:hypothetical protein